MSLQRYSWWQAFFHIDTSAYDPTTLLPEKDPSLPSGSQWEEGWVYVRATTKRKLYLCRESNQGLTGAEPTHCSRSCRPKVITSFVYNSVADFMYRHCIMTSQMFTIFISSLRNSSKVHLNIYRWLLHSKYLIKHGQFKCHNSNSPPPQTLCYRAGVLHVSTLRYLLCPSFESHIWFYSLHTHIRTCNCVMLFPHNFLSSHSVKQCRHT